MFPVQHLVIRFAKKNTKSTKKTHNLLQTSVFVGRRLQHGYLLQCCCCSSAMTAAAAATFGGSCPKSSWQLLLRRLSLLTFWRAIWPQGGTPTPSPSPTSTQKRPGNGNANGMRLLSKFEPICMPQSAGSSAQWVARTSSKQLILKSKKKQVKSAKKAKEKHKRKHAEN